MEIVTNKVAAWWLHLSKREFSLTLAPCRTILIERPIAFTVTKIRGEVRLAQVSAGGSWALVCGLE